MHNFQTFDHTFSPQQKKIRCNEKSYVIKETTKLHRYTFAKRPKSNTSNSAFILPTLEEKEAQKERKGTADTSVSPRPYQILNPSRYDSIPVFLIPIPKLRSISFLLVKSPKTHLHKGKNSKHNRGPTLRHKTHPDPCQRLKEIIWTRNPIKSISMRDSPLRSAGGS